jgi:hypothetical protein
VVEGIAVLAQRNQKEANLKHGVRIQRLQRYVAIIDGASFGNKRYWRLSNDYLA